MSEQNLNVRRGRMCNYSDGAELLEYIKEDIEKKYGVTNSIFTFRGKDIDKIEDLENLIDDYLTKQRWVQYKRVSENCFDLKEYFPNPSDQFCNKTVDFYIEQCKKEHSPAYFSLGTTIYNEKEARRELFLRLRLGYAEIGIGRVPYVWENKKRTIFSTSVRQLPEIFHQVDSGYLVLERKD